MKNNAFANWTTKKISLRDFFGRCEKTLCVFSDERSGRKLDERINCFAIYSADMKKRFAFFGRMKWTKIHSISNCMVLDDAQHCIWSFIRLMLEYEKKWQLNYLRIHFIWRGKNKQREAIHWKSKKEQNKLQNVLWKTLTI